MEPAFTGGSGPPLVLLHAAFTSWRLWEPLLPFLTPHRTVFAPTLAGCIGGPPLPDGRLGGDTLADLLEPLLDEVGIDQADIVGNSIGGFAAMELARRGRARRLVGIAPMGMYDHPEAVRIERLIVRQWAMAHAPRALVTATMRSARARTIALKPLIKDGGAVSPALAAHVVEATRHCAVPSVFDAIRGDDGALPPIQSAEEIKTPTLLLWGDRDPYATRAQMDRYLAALPDARLVELPGHAHCPQLEIPERIAREILDFTA